MLTPMRKIIFHLLIICFLFVRWNRALRELGEANPSVSISVGG
jgi:hypothetical protein